MKNFDNYGLDMLQAVIALALSFLMIGAWAIAGLPLLYVSLPILGYSFWKMYKVFQKWRFWKSANHSVVVHVPYSRLADNAKAGNTLIGYGGQWSIDSARLAFLAKVKKCQRINEGNLIFTLLQEIVVRFWYLLILLACIVLLLVLQGRENRHVLPC